MGHLVFHLIEGGIMTEGGEETEEVIAGEGLTYLLEGSVHTQGMEDGEPFLESRDAVLQRVDMLAVKDKGSPTTMTVLSRRDPFEVIEMVVEGVAIKMVALVVR